MARCCEHPSSSSPRPPQLTTHDANLTQLNVLKLRESQTAKGGELEAEADAVRAMQGNVRAAEESLLSQQQLEHVRHIQLQTQAALAKRLVAAARGEYQPAAEADDTAAWLLTVVESLSQEHPHFAAVLSSVVQAVSAP